MYPQCGPGAVCGLCGPFVGSIQFTVPQRRPVGADAHPFGWGKHRVRLYAARIRRGAAPAPLPPKGGERNIMQKKKTAIITARMTPADKKAITQRAKAAGMTVTDYLTTCALGKEIVRIDGLDDLLSELKAQGRNLNRLPTLANMGRLSVLRGDDLLREYTRLCDTLGALVWEVR